MICTLVSCLLMTSCQSVKVVYVDKYIVPNYNYPKFPPLKREINEDESWTIPKESVDLLAEFYLKYTALEKMYQHDKELYERIENDTNTIH